VLDLKLRTGECCGHTVDVNATTRELWLAVEPIHAVIYFVPDVYDALAEAGTKGFWMGYFGHRAAPMGPVSAGVVEATFFNFAPEKVRRAVPDVWNHVSPDELCRVRREASARLLARLTADLPGTVVAGAVERLEAVAAAADTAGRPLAAANQQLPPATDLHERLWQATTTIREHRGDGHVALLVANGLDGLEVHVLQAATGVVPRERLLAARGWTDDEWDAAAARLVERGWLEPSGALTEQGRARRQAIEDATDELAAVRGVDLGPAVEAARPIADAVAAADLIRYPNPIGLPPPT
jgi:hypothetical protein